MKKVFISQPRRGRTQKELEAEYSQIIQVARIYAGGDIEVVNPIHDVEHRVPLEDLGDRLKLLATVDLAVFAPYYWEAYHCGIEHQICEQYGVLTIEIATTLGYEPDHERAEVSS